MRPITPKRARRSIISNRRAGRDHVKYLDPRLEAVRVRLRDRLVGLLKWRGSRGGRSHLWFHRRFGLSGSKTESFIPWRNCFLMYWLNVGFGFAYFRACRLTHDLVCPRRTTPFGTVRNFPAILTRTGFTPGG